MGLKLDRILLSAEGFFSSGMALASFYNKATEPVWRELLNTFA